MLKFKMLTVIGMFFTLSASAGFGTRGGGKQIVIYYGEVAHCVGMQDSDGTQIEKIRCMEEQCDAELLCTDYGLVLE